MADSLNIIDQVCFVQKLATTRELYDALMNNWEGYEELRQIINGKIPRYGNGNPEADKYVRFTASTYADGINRATGPRGRFSAGCYPVTANVVPATYGSVTFNPAGIQASESTTVTIGNGSSYAGFLPFDSYASYSFDEMIYPGGGDMVAGQITHISFHYHPSNGAINHSMDIYLKEVGSTSVFTSDTPIPVSSNDRYFTGTVTASNVDQWVTIELDDPFTYNGTDNILVAVDCNDGPV